MHSNSIQISNQFIVHKNHQRQNTCGLQPFQSRLLLLVVLTLLLLLKLLLGVGEVPPVAPLRGELGAIVHLSHGPELPSRLVPEQRNVRSMSVCGVATRPVDAEAVVHPLEVEVHLLEDGVLGPVPVLLHSHGVGQGLHVHQVVGDGVPRLLDGASRGDPHPRDGVAGHLGGEGEEPAHDGQLGGVVVRDVRQPGWHVVVVASSGSLVPAQQ